MVVVLPDGQAEDAVSRLAAAGEQAWRLGRVEAHDAPPCVRFDGRAYP
jgi:phosphoribosylaminoimidazole (AIR) synthetase